MQSRLNSLALALDSLEEVVARLEGAAVSLE
jgi:exonuclease VII small subunit